MDIVLTGATGFTGRNFLLSALQSGSDLRIWAPVRSRPEWLLRLKEKYPTALTLTNSDGAELPARADVVVHLAADKKESPGVLACNRELTERALSLAERCACSRFVFLSSLSVLGETHARKVSEASSYIIESVYAESKKVCEELVATWQKKSGREAWILRTGLIYGAHDTGPMRTYCQWLTQRRIAIRLGAEPVPKTMTAISLLTDVLLELARRREISPKLSTLHVVDSRAHSLRDVETALKRRGHHTVPVVVPRAALKVAGLCYPKLRFFLAKVWCPTQVGDERLKELFPSIAGDRFETTIEKYLKQ